MACCVWLPNTFFCGFLLCLCVPRPQATLRYAEQPAATDQYIHICGFLPCCPCKAAKDYHSTYPAVQVPSSLRMVGEHSASRPSTLCGCLLRYVWWAADGHCFSFTFFLACSPKLTTSGADIVCYECCSLMGFCLSAWWARLGGPQL